MLHATLKGIEALKTNNSNEQTKTSLWQYYKTQANNVVYGHEQHKSKYDNNQQSILHTHSVVPLNSNFLQFSLQQLQQQPTTITTALTIISHNDTKLKWTRGKEQKKCIQKKTAARKSNSNYPCN